MSLIAAVWMDLFVSGLALKYLRGLRKNTKASVGNWNWPCLLGNDMMSVGLSVWVCGFVCGSVGLSYDCASAC